MLIEIHTTRSENDEEDSRLHLRLSDQDSRRCKDQTMGCGGKQKILVGPEFIGKRFTEKGTVLVYFARIVLFEEFELIAQV